MYIIIVIAALLFLGWLIFNTYFIKSTSHSISFNLPSNLTVLHISDLHGKTRFLNGRLSKIVTNYHPDILLITGDLVNRKSQLPSVIHEIKKISDSGIKVYFTPGNYERETINLITKRNIDEMEYQANQNALKDYVTVLENSGEIITFGQSSLKIYGFDNSIYGNERDYTADLPPKSDLTIFLAHSPNIISYIRERGLDFNLLFVGHTHGGQIRLFGKTIGSYKNFHVGLKKLKKKQYFFITRGIGTVKLPFRINCYPEIGVFKIR